MTTARLDGVRPHQKQVSSQSLDTVGSFHLIRLTLLGLAQQLQNKDYSGDITKDKSRAVDIDNLGWH